MIWQNNDIAKFAADNAQYQPLPDELFNKSFAVWDIDFSNVEGVRNIEWERFVAGQKTMHTTYSDIWFQGAVIGGNVEYGSNSSSFDGMFQENDSISILLKNDVYSTLTELTDLEYKLITVGDDRETWFFARLFKDTLNLDGSLYGGRMELINIKFLLDKLNDGEVGLVQNIKVGNFGETVKVPYAIYDDVNQVELMETRDFTRITPDKMEVFIPTATGLIGLDMLNKDGTRIKDATFSTNTDVFPSHADEYSILPTQFKIFSVDNYGMAHQADITNAIRSILFTDTVSSDTITSSTSSGGVVGTAGTFLKSVVGLAQGANSLYQKGSSIGSKVFGDKTEAATQPALGTANLSGDTSLLKVFVESDMADTERMQTVNGKQYVDISTQDVFEINGRKGTASTFNSDLLPAGITGAAAIGQLLKAGEYVVGETIDTVANAINAIPGAQGLIGTDTKGGKYLNDKGTVDTARRFNVLGVKGLNQVANPSLYTQAGSNLLPWLRLPYAYDAIKTTQSELNLFMNYGTPRRQTGNPTKLGKPYTMENWETFLRSNVFRPDAYSYWNWPIMYPSSVVNIYTDENDSNFINYDKFGVGNSQAQTKHWTKGFTAGDFTNNDFQDVADTFFSFKVEGLSNDFSELESMLITSGQAIVKVYDADGTEEEFKFNSTGALYGSAAKVNNKWTF